MRIGFIGLGAMGHHMAANLLKSGQRFEERVVRAPLDPGAGIVQPTTRCV